MKIAQQLSQFRFLQTSFLLFTLFHYPQNRIPKFQASTPTKRVPKPNRKLGTYNTTDKTLTLPSLHNQKQEDKDKLSKKTRKKKEDKISHSRHLIVLITGDMEPSAGIHKRRVPALKNVVRIVQAPPQRVERVTLRVCRSRRQKKQQNQSQGQGFESPEPERNLHSFAGCGTLRLRVQGELGFWEERSCRERKSERWDLKGFYLLRGDIKRKVRIGFGNETDTTQQR